MSHRFVSVILEVHEGYAPSRHLCRPLPTSEEKIPPTKKQKVLTDTLLYLPPASKHTEIASYLAAIPIFAKYCQVK